MSLAARVVSSERDKHHHQLLHSVLCDPRCSLLHNFGDDEARHRDASYPESLLDSIGTSLVLAEVGIVETQPVVGHVGSAFLACGGGDDGGCCDDAVGEQFAGLFGGAAAHFVCCCTQLEQQKLPLHTCDFACLQAEQSKFCTHHTSSHFPRWD